MPKGVKKDKTKAPVKKPRGYHNYLEYFVALLRKYGLSYKEYQIGETTGKYRMINDVLLVKNREGIYERYGNN